MQFVEQFCYEMVDVFRTIVGVKATNDEGEEFEHRCEHGYQESLTDARDGADEFKLRDLIDGVDAIHTLHPLEVTLVHGVHAQVTGLALRVRLSLIHISEPTRQAEISYAVFCLK